MMEYENKPIFKKTINETDINKFLFINGIMGKITEINNDYIFIIPYAKSYYKKIIIDDEYNTAKIYYRYRPTEMRTMKIITNNLFFVIDNYSFNKIIVCIKYNQEADYLTEILENDQEGERNIFKTHLMNDIKKYLLEVNKKLSIEETNQKKQLFKNKYEYHPDELKEYLTDIIYNYGFNKCHLQLAEDVINDIYNEERKIEQPRTLQPV